MERCQNTIDDHIFLSLKSDKPLSKATIGHILGNVSELAGLDRHLYSARSYRRGGATTAVAKNQNWCKVLKLGRWQSVETFFRHYVQTDVDDDYTDNILIGPRSIQNSSSSLTTAGILTNRSTTSH